MLTEFEANQLWSRSVKWRYLVLRIVVVLGLVPACCGCSAHPVHWPVNHLCSTLTYTYYSYSEQETSVVLDGRYFEHCISLKADWCISATHPRTDLSYVSFRPCIYYALPWVICALLQPPTQSMSYRACHGDNDNLRYVACEGLRPLLLDSVK